MSRCFDVVVERDQDGLYVASVPALRGCHTQATSLDDLMERIRESMPPLCSAVKPIPLGNGAFRNRVEDLIHRPQKLFPVDSA